MRIKIGQFIHNYYLFCKHTTLIFRHIHTVIRYKNNITSTKANFVLFIFFLFCLQIFLVPWIFQIFRIFSLILVCHFPSFHFVPNAVFHLISVLRVDAGNDIACERVLFLVRSRQNWSIVRAYNVQMFWFRFFLVWF